MNDLIERLFAVRKRITAIKQDELKTLEAEKKELEEAIFDQLDTLGVDKTSIKGIGTVGINEAVVPQAEDWEKFYAYLQESGNFFLLNRALNAASFREAVQMGEEIPGLKPFTKRTLSVRSAA